MYLYFKIYTIESFDSFPLGGRNAYKNKLPTMVESIQIWTVIIIKRYD